MAQASLLAAALFGAVCMAQAAEIQVLTAGAVKPVLPAEIQNHTVYAGGVSAAARDGGAAKALLDWLASPTAAAVLKDKGMEAP